MTDTELQSSEIFFAAQRSAEQRVNGAMWKSVTAEQTERYFVGCNETKRVDETEETIGGGHQTGFQRASVLGLGRLGIPHVFLEKVRTHHNR
ncbi:hypothetical protein CMUS01_11694 [Colletotrichum musicola]|uniref:Uncharacterized protein n=1 Tax=Colletotrichum musicola TaxID=2175873 RepID=A0A8H6N430_9PEZI|nr:hypothetical protein CMUS01_11694 [Colletotrichum musicola]